MDYTLTFLTVFKTAIILSSPVLTFLSLEIIVLGLIVGYIEKWQRFDSLYWSFITATTVGYGDIRPLKKISRVLSIIIAFIGIMFTGIVVAITIQAANVAFDKHVDPSVLEAIKRQIQ